MTNQPDRINQIEEILLRVAQQQEVNTVGIAQNKEAITELRIVADSLLQTVDQHQDNFEILVQEIREIRAEIRGLKLETRRILNHLFGQEDS